jgi:tetratricopeptide (TPR) repeat protein
LDINRNIAQLALDIDKTECSVSDSCFRLLDEIIKTASRKIGNSRDPHYVFDSINNTLKQYNYKKKLTDRFYCLLRGDKNDSKPMDCNTASLIYIAIGEELNLPICGIAVPGHFFVRWNDNDHYVNFEIMNGKSYTDNYYIKRYNIHNESISNGIYLRSLNPQDKIGKKELLGCYLNDTALDLFKKEMYKEAIERTDQAIILYPGHAYAYYNRGVILLKHNRSKHKEAIKWFKKAIQLDPNHPNAYKNMGLCMLRLGLVHKEAEYCLEFAEALKRKRPTVSYPEPL